MKKNHPIWARVSLPLLILLSSHLCVTSSSAEEVIHQTTEEGFSYSTGTETATYTSHTEVITAPAEETTITAETMRVTTERAHAADEAGRNVKVSITPYIWLPSVSGTIAARGYTAHVSQHFTDVAKHVNVVGMVAVEAIVNDKLGFTGNINFSKLGADSSYRGVSLSSKSSMLLGDLAGFYRLGSTPISEDGSTFINWDVLAGVRIWDVDAKLDVNYGPLRFKVSQRDTWVDPIIGAKAWIRLSKNWGLDLRGDIGGFDIGSKLTWSASAIVGYNVLDNGRLFLGYRGMGVDYKNSSKGYKVDATLHGPIFGFQLRF